MPLGNLTSQIFANIYLNELDQFIKHKLKVKYYLRYADDFLILDKNKRSLLHCFETVKHYLLDQLKLEIHPNKIRIRKLSWGIDFCGYVVLPHNILPRAKTERRIFRKVSKGDLSNQSLQSYLGYFSHSNSYELRLEMKNLYFLK
ncbi:RNA-directed DNA polymerase [Candidatus Curtissbacteria bacterium]|nr:RNA-directed DNA polymerase [Candidatus Curtissbacteria bacterium]